MSMIKKIAATVIASVCAASLAACTIGESTSWVVKTDGEELAAGIFLYYQIEGEQEAYALLDDEQKEQKLEDVVIDGVSYDEFAQNYATQKCQEFSAINAKFEEAGLELTADDKTAIEGQISYIEYIYAYLYGIEDYYAEYGIGDESVYAVYETMQKSQKLFLEYYGIDGEKGVTKADVEGFFADNYVRIKTLSLDFKDADGNLLADADKQSVRDEAQKWVDRANAGESFDALISEFNGSDDSSDDATDDSSDTSSDDSSETSTDDSTDADDEETDEYPNESIYAVSSTNYSEEFYSAVQAQSAGTAFIVEEDEVIYVVYKLDVLERTDYLEENETLIIQDFKGEEYNDLLVELANEVSVVSNEKALKRYKPSKMSD